MRKLNLFKMMLLLCALIAGSTSAWAETKTYQHVFTTKPSTGNSVNLSGVNWKIEAEKLNGYNSQNYAGVQIGSKNDNGYITLTSTSDWNYLEKEKITEVRLWLNLGGTSVTPTVTIGGKSATSDGTTVVKNSSAGKDWTKATKVTFTPASDGNTGVVVIKVTTVNAGYICAMEIDCEEASTPSSIATPLISLASGTFFEAQTATITCETEGAAIYYTLDGTAPTANSTAYTAGSKIDITESCTLKAIAIKDGESSAVATATYTFPTVYDIAGFIANNGTGWVNLTGAQVVYITSDKKFMYVRDNSGAVVFYKDAGNNTELATGDFLSGRLNCTFAAYKGIPQIKDADLSTITKTGNEVVVAKEIDGTTEAIAANLCNLVKIKNTAITLSGSTYYVGDESDIKLYDNFKEGITFTADKQADVQGIAAISNDVYNIYPRFESDIVYLDNAVEVSITAAGAATFCSDKALDFTAVDAIAVYTATDNGKTVKLTEIKKVPANTPVVLMNALGVDAGEVEAINVPVLEGDADVIEANDLKVVGEGGLAGEDNIFVLAKNPTIGFYLWDKTQTLNEGKIYLQGKSSETRSFLGFDSETTGIKAIANEQLTKDNVVYNLNGLRVSQPTKGLYIVNGKKFIVK